MSEERRPDRGILLELEALFGHIERFAAAGDRGRYDSDDEYRWVLHRLWIAVGNEAAAYMDLTGRRPTRLGARCISCATSSPMSV